MCERGTPRAPGMSKMQQNTETEKQQSTTGCFFSSFTQQSGALKLCYQIPSKCTCIQTTRFGQQQRTTVYIYYTKCLLLGLFDNIDLARVWQTAEIPSRPGNQTLLSRHRHPGRHRCGADTRKSLAPFFFFSIFSGKDSRLMLHSRALCKLEKNRSFTGFSILTYTVKTSFTIRTSLLLKMF